ncbi:hypothetical protein [Nocardioides sp. SLBN-35]|uniref:hypothetical protein n=1 Tax=Nocardioides sp. SLBN-35 TaxID=2768445 RepID=UPI0011726595|nr:hypothetical protein [Nocardioides sp. SLBN-35]TQK70272.1 hypothetical protein FBY23_2046 [Nocardioides sp. SLBN-35]
MEILFWLLPAAVLTLASMAWVAWWGREGRGQVDRETAARRLGEALTREQRSRPGYAAPQRAPERHTGVALRASQARPSVVAGGEVEEPAAEPDVQADDATGDRRAS